MKFITLAMLTISGVMTGGCVMAVGNTTTETAPVAIQRETISYETSPCFGTCPVYRVMVRPDGSGVFEGKRFTKVNGIRAFRASPEQYRAFAGKLERYRPRQGELLIQPGRPGCQNAPTDMPSVDIRWNEASGAAQHLSFYYGCAMSNQAMNEALRSVPNELPIRSFIEPDRG